MSLDSTYTSRKLTLRQLSEWSEQGLACHNELASILSKTQRELTASRSPSKAINKSIKNLQTFFSRKDVRGSIDEKNNRNIEFYLNYPQKIDDGLSFCFAEGQINGRSGKIVVNESKPIVMSFHALQRLFERIGAENDSLVLDEIFSSIKWAPAWNEAGKNIQAQCWPILSEHGFFVVAQNETFLPATLITWMPSSNLSKKWGLVYANIIQLKTHHIELMFNANYIKEFIGSFPWMMQEHNSGIDLEGLAWQSKDFEINNEPELKALDNFTETVYSDKHITYVKSSLKKSSSYISGLNYQPIHPPFKKYSIFIGVIVQKKEVGALIVSLQNSWFGQIPLVSLKKTHELGVSLENLNVGDNVEVTVWKITYLSNENAYDISLDLRALSEAVWRQVESNYPIGSQHKCLTYGRVGSDIAVELCDGTRGIVPIYQLEWLVLLDTNLSQEIIGQEFDLIVKGYKKIKRNLILEIPNFEKFYKAIVSKEIKAGENVKGTVSHLHGAYANIQLEIGCTALLHDFNCWDRSMPDVGDNIEAKVLDIDFDNSVILIGFKPEFDKTPYFAKLSLSAEKWICFEKKHFEGERVPVQVLAIKSWGYLVGMNDGNFGTLPFKELNWTNDSETQKKFLKIGDILEVQISKINVDKKQILFSKKAITPNPLEEIKNSLAINQKYLGKVVNKVDYGYFITLPFGTDGLLHISVVPEYLNFEKGDEIEVYISALDYERMRISLVLEPVK